MSALTWFVLRHRRWVMMFWVVALLLGGAAAQQVSDRLSYDFSLTGQPGYETSLKILKTYGTSGQDAPALLVLTAPPGQRVPPSVAAATFAAVARSVPQARIVGLEQTGDPVFRTADGRSEFSFAFLPRPIADQVSLAPLRSALAAPAPAGTAARVSGLPALQSGGSATGPGVLAETLIGGLGALAVLLFVFASFLALVPLLVAAVSVLSAFFVLLGLTYLSDVSFVVEFLIALVGLGVAIDYSLLVVTRWREERSSGGTNEAAVVRTMQTAGRAVVFSGLTVAIGLLALVLLPVPFLRSIGYGGALIPLISVAVAVTLLPAVLGGLGPRVDWPRLRREDRASRFWHAWAGLMIRRRRLAAGVAAALLAALTIPVFTISLGQARSDSLAAGGPAFEAWQQLRQGGVPGGVLTPVEILSTDATAPAVAQRARNVPGMAAAFVPSGPVAHRAGTAVTVAVPRPETASGSDAEPVRQLRSALSRMPGVAGLAGIGAVQLDYRSGVLDRFPLALALIILVTYLLLVRVFRSLVLPLQAVLLNLISLAATFGGMVWFWQDGHGSQAIFGIPRTGAITFWIPQLVFAFLFGLSMDYEVFLLARIREEYDRSGSTDRAVSVALARTGRLITSAALILFLAFLSLASGPETELKVFATGLGFGILLDATVVRMVLVPALISLLGAWNWYLPRPLARLLRVPAAPLPDGPELVAPRPIPSRIN